MSEFLTNAGFGLLRRLGGSILASLSWGQIAVLAAGGLFVLVSTLGGVTRLLRRPRILAIAAAGVAVALMSAGWTARTRAPGLLAAPEAADELATPGDEPVVASELVEPPAGSDVLADLASMSRVTSPPSIGLAPSSLGLVPSLLPMAIPAAGSISHLPAGGNPPAPQASPAAGHVRPGGVAPAPAAKAAHAPTRVAPRGFNTATGPARPAKSSSAGTTGRAGVANRQLLARNAANQGRGATNRGSGIPRGNAGAYGGGRGFGGFGAAPQHAGAHAASQAAMNRMASHQMDLMMNGMMQQQMGGGHPMGGIHPMGHVGHPMGQGAHHPGHH